MGQGVGADEGDAMIALYVFLGIVLACPFLYWTTCRAVSDGIRNAEIAAERDYRVRQGAVIKKL